jgi:hypothetical protein
MTPILPPEAIERFTREHPVQAAILVMFGLALCGFAVWALLAGP